MSLFASLAEMYTETVAETAAASASSATDLDTLVAPYAGITVPVLNLILQVLALILLLGVLVGGVLLLRHHVRDWLFPFGIGLVFNLVFQYMFFAQGFGVFRFLLWLLEDKAGFLKGQVRIQSLILIVLQAGFAVLSIILAFAYWNKKGERDSRRPSLGGAIAIGFSFYLVGILTNGYLSQFFNMITYSRSINEMGLDQFLKEFFLMQQNAGEFTWEGTGEVIENFKSLAEPNPVRFLLMDLIAILMAFETSAHMAAAVFYYCYRFKTDRKNHGLLIGMIALEIALFLPSIVLNFLPEVENDVLLAVISLVYSLLLAGVSLFFGIRAAVTHAEKEWTGLSYTRTMRKKDEEARKNKMPKIEMPKD